MTPLSIFIGYDERESDAYDVCRASLLRHATRSLHIVRLDQDPLRRAGWYRREWRQEGENRVDMGDLKPFSTGSAFTRFLVPALSLYRGWALFCGSDFLFTSDIAELFDMADERFAVRVVKHEHKPVERTKMGGIVQSPYTRKNWSSLVLWNCGHPDNAMLTGHIVNEWAGGWLHAFSWLRDDQVGDLPLRWNWLAGVNPDLGIVPAGIHYTLGVPSMPGCADTPHADRWRAARASLSAT